MTLPAGLVEAIASALATAIEPTSVGHCIRVDSLDRDDARLLAASLAGRSSSFRAVVLGDAPTDALFVSAEQAVEIRNRKTTRLCLLVPADLAESSTSSLGNAFAVYDLDAELRIFVAAAIEQLPVSIRDVVRAAAVAQRGPTSPTAEDLAGYLAAVSDSPDLETIGKGLWRVGLIPDLGPDGPLMRLADNARCARLIARPSRPQMGADERVEAIGVQPGALRDQLVRFLQGRSLRDWRTWLKELGDPAWHELSFHRWPLETDEPSDLEGIELAPFLGPDGTIEKWTNLLQPSGPGTEPIVTVGPQTKVTIRWKPTPRNPEGLARWRLRIVPSLDEHPMKDRMAVDLPEITVAASRRTGSLSLDLDLETVEVRAVRVEVVALDEFQSEIKGLDGQHVEGLSDEFWLDDRGP